MHRQSTYSNQRENQDQANNNGSLVAKDDNKSINDETTPLARADRWVLISSWGEKHTEMYFKNPKCLSYLRSGRRDSSGETDVV